MEKYTLIERMIDTPGVGNARARLEFSSYGTTPEEEIRIAYITFLYDSEPIPISSSKMFGRGGSIVLDISAREKKIVGCEFLCPLMEEDETLLFEEIEQLAAMESISEEGKTIAQTLLKAARVPLQESWELPY